MKADLTRTTFVWPSTSRACSCSRDGAARRRLERADAILLHYLQTLAADIIGPRGGPADNCGFVISPVTVARPG